MHVCTHTHRDNFCLSLGIFLEEEEMGYFTCLMLLLKENIDKRHVPKEKGQSGIIGPFWLVK